MKHPDTLTIPRAVVEQALDALALYANTYNLYWIRGMPILEPSAEAVLEQLRAALQPQADTSVLQAAPWPPAGETLTEPEAMRYDFDGYGWKYIDNGSGSDWMTRHPEGEFLFTKPQTAAEPHTFNDESPFCVKCGGTGEAAAEPVTESHSVTAYKMAKALADHLAVTPVENATPPATQAALTAALDYLWVVVEHNRLHFGDSHNTVIQGQAVVAQIEALKGPTP